MIKRIEGIEWGGRVANDHQQCTTIVVFGDVNHDGRYRNLTAMHRDIRQ